MCTCVFVFAHAHVYVHEHLRIFICCVLRKLLILLYFILFYSFMCIYACLLTSLLSYNASSFTIIYFTLLHLCSFRSFFFSFLFFLAHTYVRTYTGHSVSKDTKSVQSTTLNPDFFSFYEFSTTLPGPSLLKVSHFRDIDFHCSLITNEITDF